MSDDIVFDSLEPTKKTVSLEGKKYILHEASGDAEVKFTNARSRTARMNDGKITGMEGVGDLEPYLVSLCLYRADVSDPEVPKLFVTKAGLPDPAYLVPLAQIRSWPARVQRKLFDTAKEISGIDQPETVEALEKRIAADTEKLALLRGHAEGNGQAATTPMMAGSA